MLDGTSLPKHLSAAEAGALRELVEGARRLLGPVLQRAVLFGSRARGASTEDSDVDVALVVAEGGRALRRPVQDLAWDIHMRTGVNIAPLVIEEAALERLRARELHLARALDNEGIAL